MTIKGYIKCFLAALWNTIGQLILFILFVLINAAVFIIPIHYHGFIGLWAGFIVWVLCAWVTAVTFQYIREGRYND